MKKLIIAVLVALFAAPVTASAAEQIVVGVTPFPHKDIMEVVKPILAEKGYELVIKEFSDYVQPNMALAEGVLDANFFQHQPYLDNMNREKKLGLASVAMIHVEPLGLYCTKIEALKEKAPGDFEGKLALLIPELKEGAKISVPNDPTNGARALRLLEAYGIIKLKEGDLVTARDITENPYNIEIVELDAAQLPRTLQDVLASVINSNFAGQAGLVPSRDAIVMEAKDSPYANVIAVREADKDSDKIKALRDASQSQQVREFIVKELEPKGILPSF
ncbi:MAG: MetQ/NlpA family ABC transporter substrate-binding protein [Desulfovibrionaceae bacterium]|nr:MetQ/NlpA family ABC transporter substrate-binding protein [Desulfovibrionaceae bacterium]